MPPKIVSSLSMRHFRFVTIVICIWIIAQWITRTYVGIGWFWPLRVASSSMAPALLGPYAQKKCPRCFEQLIVDATEGLPAEGVCYNCGNRIDSWHDATLRSGSRIVIDRWTARREGPSRFDIVAFATSELTGDWATKRIVGLPGEDVSIFDGDILINGHCAPKNVAQFMDSAILVHVDRGMFPKHSRSGLAPRHPHSCWTTTSDRRWDWTVPSSSDSRRETLDWLDYVHQCSPQVVVTPPMHGRILDEYAYNQADSRPLHEVTDIASTAMIRVRGTGLVRIQMRTPAGQAELRLRTDAAPELFLNEQTLQFTDTTARVVDLRTKMRLLFGYWDQQLVFRLGDSVEYRFPIATRTTDNARLASLPPPYFSIAVQGPDSVLLTDWMLWRDVHYYADSDSGMWARFQPREDQFVLLGDNTSRSKDARFSPQYGIVPRDHILGIVTRVN